MAARRRQHLLRRFGLVGQLMQPAPVGEKQGAIMDIAIGVALVREQRADLARAHVGQWCGPIATSALPPHLRSIASVITSTSSASRTCAPRSAQHVVQVWVTTSRSS